MEAQALTKRPKAELDVAKLKMLRISLGVIRIRIRIRNKHISTGQTFGKKVREATLRCFGRVQRDSRRMLKIVLPGRKQRGR